jgi:hypothetical protein
MRSLPRPDSVHPLPPALLLRELRPRGSVQTVCRRSQPNGSLGAMNILRFLLTSFLALDLSACVESRAPLLTQTEPTAGQQFQLNFYEDFQDGKAHEFHAAIYRWNDGKYVRSGGMARDVKNLAAEPLGHDDFILQGGGETESSYFYWIARKLFPGAYLIFPIEEADVDDGIRKAICQTDKANTCVITAHDQLVALAQATAARPVRNGTLGVVLEK